AMVGCIAGAVLIEETKEMIHSAGLVIVDCKMNSDFIDQMSTWSDPLYIEISKHLPPEAKPGDYVTSLNVTAKKR
ncbi:MAG: hypothetical protein GX428_12255, partial [Candidatus Atribacteria bacterium]|nr:hypothetical protein [Candidatus Atribacteria bacterium]